MDKGEYPLPKERLGFSTATCLSVLHGPPAWPQPTKEFKISFLIENPQTTLCGLMSHQDIYKSPQQLGKDRSTSEEHALVSASGQARDVLVREEVSLVHGHPDTLPSPALLWAL